MLAPNCQGGYINEKGKEGAFLIRDVKRFQRFEADLARREGPVDLRRTMDQIAALWKEGVALGVLPPKDPLEGIETDIRLARILNSCFNASS